MHGNINHKSRNAVSDNTRIQLVLRALSGKKRAVLSKLGSRLGQPQLAQKALGEHNLGFDRGERSAISTILPLTERLLAGEDDMFGNTVPTGQGIVPAFFTKGDADVAERLKKLLRRWHGGASPAQVLHELLPDAVESVEEGEDILNGDKPLGLIPVQELFQAFEKEDIPTPTIHQLLGLSGPAQPRPAQLVAPSTTGPLGLAHVPKAMPVGTPAAPLAAVPADDTAPDDDGDDFALDALVGYAKRHNTRFCDRSLEMMVEKGLEPKDLDKILLLDKPVAGDLLMGKLPWDKIALRGLSELLGVPGQHLLNTMYSRHRALLQTTAQTAAPVTEPAAVDTTLTETLTDEATEMTETTKPAAQATPETPPAVTPPALAFTGDMRTLLAYLNGHRLKVGGVLKMLFSDLKIDLEDVRGAMIRNSAGTGIRDKEMFRDLMDGKLDYNEAQAVTILTCLNWTDADCLLDELEPTAEKDTPPTEPVPAAPTEDAAPAAPEDPAEAPEQAQATELPQPETTPAPTEQKVPETQADADMETLVTLGKENPKAVRTTAKALLARAGKLDKDLGTFLYEESVISQAYLGQVLSAMPFNAGRLDAMLAFFEMTAGAFLGEMGLPAAAKAETDTPTETSATDAAASDGPAPTEAVDAAEADADATGSSADADIWAKVMVKASDGKTFAPQMKSLFAALPDGFSKNAFGRFAVEKDALKLATSISNHFAATRWPEALVAALLDYVPMTIGQLWTFLETGKLELQVTEAVQTLAADEAADEPDVTAETAATDEPAKEMTEAAADAAAEETPTEDAAPAAEPETEEKAEETTVEAEPTEPEPEFAPAPGAVMDMAAYGTEETPKMEETETLTFKVGIHFHPREPETFEDQLEDGIWLLMMEVRQLTDTTEKRRRLMKAQKALTGL